MAGKKNIVVSLLIFLKKWPVFETDINPPIIPKRTNLSNRGVFLLCSLTDGLFGIILLRSDIYLSFKTLITLSEQTEESWIQPAVALTAWTITKNL